MKTNIIIGLCMAFVLLAGTAGATDWNVTWTPIKESIIDKEYIIEVQNLQDTARSVNISSFFSETDFDIAQLSDIEFYEWAEVPYTYSVDHYDEVNHSEHDPANDTWNNWTEHVYNWTETIESTKLDWEECKSQLFKENSKTKEDNYGFINIPKFGSSDDGDGTYNGTKVFKLTFTTPVVHNISFGSLGKVALLLDGEEHHPYWNTSWLYKKEVVLTGNTSGAQTDYQLLLNITYAAGMQIDFDDLRFTNETHEIDAWLESKVDSSYALVWVEFPTTPENGVEQTYYMYYGNDGAASDWDGNATFCQYHGAASSNFLDSVASPYEDIAIRIKWKCGSTTNTWWGIGTVLSDDGGDQIWFKTTTTHEGWYYGKRNNGGSADMEYGSPGWDANFHITDLIYNNTQALTLYTDDIHVGTSVSNNAIKPDQNMGLGMFITSGTAEQEWSFVRKYVASPSTVSFESIWYYTDSIYYNVSNPYNHTIDSNGMIAVSHATTSSDDINWTASALTDDCHLIVTEYNPSNHVVANFTVFTASIDWLRVTNLTPDYTHTLQYANNTTINISSTDANGTINFTDDLPPGDYQVLSKRMEITLYSSSPETIQTNYTGEIHVNYIVSSPCSINTSSLAVLFGLNYTTTGDMHSYLAVPTNSIASEGIYRAPNRNTTPYLSWENNTTITEGNVWQWGGGDDSSWWINITPINATHTWLNATGIPEHAFQSSFYLKKGSMYSAPKTAFEVNAQQGIIIKMWDNEVIRGRGGEYLMNMFFDSDWESTLPTDPIELWGLNSSFNPDTDDPSTSVYGAKMAEWDGNRWVNHSWVPGANASYAYPLVLNASSFPVILDEINYIYLKSLTQSSKSYILNATNHDPGICNITYAQTETMWTYNELADVSTPVAYTPSFFTTFVRDDEEFLHHLYIADDEGTWAHSDINSISIGVSHYPVTPTSFDYFNITCPTGYTHDTRMDATYDSGYMYTGIYCHADPDGGNVSHNITLHYVNETIAGIINNTLQTTGSGVHEINFPTSPYYSTTESYTLKCVSTDDEGVAVTTWLDSYFTLAADGSQGYYINDYLMFWGMNDIPTLYSIIANDSLISYDAADDIYTMHVPFFKSKCNDTFRFNETVHLESLNTEDVAYFKFHGVTIFDYATIHAWNTTSDTVAPSTDAYRGYLLSYCQSRGNITNSNLSYLGSDVYRQEGLNFICNSHDYLIYNTTLSHNSRGVIIEECENFNISHCSVCDNVETGIGLYYSDNNIVENTTVCTSAYDPCIYLYEASDNSIRHNTVADCTDYGIRIRSNSNNNTLIGNDITGIGIYDYYFSSAAINNTIRDPASATDKIRVTSTSQVNIENTDNTAFAEDSLNSTYAYPANFSMSVAGVSHTFNITQCDMTVVPETDNVSIWNLVYDIDVTFNASSDTPTNQVWFNFTNTAWEGRGIIVDRNGAEYYSGVADANGTFNYNYSGGWSAHYFAFVPGSAIDVVTPANGATGTSTNPTLSVLVNDPNGDAMNVTFYQSGGDQIGTTQNNTPSGTTASVVWSGRSYNTEYYWYAETDVGGVVVQSVVWSFTTQGSGSGSSHVIAITGCTDWSGNSGTQAFIDFGCTGETAAAVFTTNATEGTLNSVTGIWTWDTVPADAGTYNWRFNVENVYGVSDYCDVTVTVYHYASPLNITATTGNFWVDHTWGGNGYVDSYNVSVNGVWTNGSATQRYYHIRSPHAWSNISVAAFNDTTGLSSFISNAVQVPNNAIVLTNYAALVLATAGDTVTVDMNHEDLDGDSATYYCSRMDLFADFNTADGTGQYTNAINGTHEVIFGVTDGYGWSNQTITIEVGQVHPLELDEETPLLLFVVLVILLFGALFYIYHAASYVAKIVTSLISTWMSFMLSNMAVSGNVVLNYAELSSGDVFVYGSHSIQIAALSHFFMFTGVVSALFMLAFAVKLVIDTYLDIQEKRKADEEWDGVEQ